LGEKVELAIMFTSGRDEIVLLQCSNMMFGHPIVNVQRVSELVHVVRLYA